MSNSTLRHRVGAQSLTELALLMPLLALLLVGLVELGFLLHARVQVTSAAREAARAASLYRATRYATISDNNLTTAKCEGSINGWSLQQTVEQAVVRYGLDANGCPASGAIESSALGLLATTRAASGTTAPPCPTTDVGGWVVGVKTDFIQLSGDDMPKAGEQATVTLCYPHHMLIASELLSYFGEPIWVRSSVVFAYQQ